VQPAVRQTHCEWRYFHLNTNHYQYPATAPLSKGMFVQVVLRGKSHRARILVPRSAVRDGTVMVADRDNRLRRRPVKVLFSQGWISAIEKGLTPGERVLVSDLVPAVEGMLLQPTLDAELAAALSSAAEGDGS